MTVEDIEKLRYPIGHYLKPELISGEDMENYITDIASFPSRIRKEVEHLNDEQLGTPYRPQGWTIRQIVHHCADSHMNAFIRFKLALTEEMPVIKPYFEDRWAELPDTTALPPEVSLTLLESLHNRWVTLLKELKPEDLMLGYLHPEHGRIIYLDEATGTYAWHSNHHLAHITVLKANRNWR